MRTVLLGLSSVLCGLIGLCYVYQFDVVAALTIIPVWCWLAPGLLLTLPGWFRRRRRAAMLVTGVWLIVVGLLADEPASLVRQVIRGDSVQPDAGSTGTLRVVTLNCGSGGLRAAREVASYEPDIVLLQEAPSQEHVESLARELYGKHGIAIGSPDASIVARAELIDRTKDVRVGADYAAAWLRLADGRQAVVVSLRLPPYEIRWDFWSPECWTSQASIRRAQRERLHQILNVAHTWGTSMSLILGGDFNAPPGDAIDRSLEPQWRDVFAVAGYGWGNTVLNDWPLQRVDRIWIDRRLIARRASAERTRSSDHRLVVADLEWRERISPRR